MKVGKREIAYISLVLTDQRSYGRTKVDAPLFKYMFMYLCIQ